jgi:hypothetical protein
MYWGSFVFLLLVGIALAAFAFVGWLAFLLAGEEPKDDRVQSNTRSPTLARRMRAWLKCRPERLTYRRDERGRFRKVRRW